ncbi:MAG: 50S ribosomal protein L22 [Sulfolobales archaeon]|nr:50S ribosomal protein L22 [Sulfolobales archaeon]MCX8208867.1 50S ribosomal protein L22 [Sulfolobales archaeon]MDW8010792.1 50S ribosomal protein L22 [Sulfolobales archaeon]
MPVWRYSVRLRDESRIAKAVLWDAPISRKEAYEILKVLRGMKLTDAKKFLEDVIAMKRAVPYSRYKLSIAHKSGLADSFPKWKSPIGRYPVKTAKYILKLLSNLENNAESKGLDVERLAIVHAAAHRGPYLKRWMPRAFGRATPKFRSLTHVEMMVKEV